MVSRRHILLAGLAFPAIAHARFVPRKAELSILRTRMPSHRTDVRDVDDYRIFRAIPDSPRRAIYLLDGNGAFDALTPAMLAQVPDLAVIGIGYPTEMKFDTDRRSLDYTPPIADGPVPDPDQAGRMVGGANLFLPRLTGPLRTAAEEGLDIRTRTLWGHSFGGLFGLYTLFTRPDGFDRYATISPSLWWGDGQALRLEASAAPLTRQTPLLIAYGDAEARRGNMDEETFRKTQATALAQREAFVKRLRTHRALQVDETVFTGLGHGETLAASLPLALALA